MPTGSFTEKSMLAPINAAAIGVTIYQDRHVYRVARLDNPYDGVFVKVIAFSNNFNQVYTLMDILFSRDNQPANATAVYIRYNLDVNIYIDETSLYIKFNYAGMAHFEIYANSQNNIDNTDVTDTIDLSSLTKIEPSSYI